MPAVFLAVSILHKYDYSLGTSRGNLLKNTFQFYISTIIAFIGTVIGIDAEQVSILHKYDYS